MDLHCELVRTLRVVLFAPAQVERQRRRRDVRPEIDRSHRWEFRAQPVADELEQPLLAVDVLQPMLAEVEEVVASLTHA